MRKTDKRNKPQLDKIGTNKIGRIRQSKEELNEAKNTLEVAKSIPRKVFFAPKGFTFNRPSKKSHIPLG